VAGILLAACTPSAIVIRHDIPDTKYQIAMEELPALAFLPDEGHGTLISKRWVLTAANAAVWRPIREITLNEVSRPVAKVIVHPGYKAAPKELQSGDASPLMKFMANSDDIALIELEHAVDDVRPVAIYRVPDEEGQIAEIVGSGATGNGLVGQYPHSPHRGELRRAYGRIISADERWLGLRFDAPPDAIALEGMPADGDSGAPVLINVHGAWQLAGVVSRKFATGQLSEFRCCVYGQITYQVRVSRYAKWIHSIIANN
jgi:hypothetical protein